MKHWMFLPLLFLLTYNEPMTVQVVRCDTVIEIQYEEDVYSIAPFNIYDWEMADVCPLLLGAHDVAIEWEPDVAWEEPIGVWIFIDGTLLQEQLIAEGKAKIMRHNPTYTYAQTLERALEDTQTISAPLHEEPSQEVKQSLRGWLLIGGLMVFSLISFGVAKKLKP